MFVYIILTAVSVFYIVLNQFMKRRLTYWKKLKVPYLEPTFIFGNFRDYILLKQPIGYVEQVICKQFPNEKYVGSFYGTEPAVIVQDLEYIKLVTTKDFYYFSSREISKYTHNEKFTTNMFFTYGDRWRVLRQNFTPLFSSAKMRNMFPLIEKCGHILEGLLEKEIGKTDVLEVNSLTARYTMDCIVSCVFGVDSNTMGEDTNNPFRRMGQLIFEISDSRGYSLVGRSIWPAIFYGLKRKVFPLELNEFFNNLLVGVFQARDYKPSSRNDFVDLLLSLTKRSYITGDRIVNMKDEKINGKINIKVDDSLLVGQCISFFAAGFETSATTMCFMLYELAKNKEAQEKAFEDVEKYLLKHNNKLVYDLVSELPYLQACFDETLRLYPVTGVLMREVVEDYVLPDGVKLEAGLRVHLPVYHLHHHPDHFPEPFKFLPERFLPENKHKIKPYSYLPFGQGPRICIGMRFGRMQSLAGILTILKDYEVDLAPDTPAQIKIDPRGLVSQPAGSVHLKFTLRNGWSSRKFAK